MRTAIPTLLGICVSLLSISPALAQVGTTDTNQFNTQYGPFAPAPQSNVGNYSTVTPQAALTPSSPSRALAPVVSQKPFSDYQLPPAVSPYMNLYQFNPNVGINNYYSLVKPVVDQQRTNQRLQAKTQAQGSAINFLDQKTDSMLDLHRPGYYMMNHNSYFGGR